MKTYDIEALLAQLRKGACPPESCPNCSLNGNCKSQAAAQAADLIEELLGRRST
jgi:hypothetical protein